MVGNRIIICDDSDEERWLEVRRDYLTASDLYTWMNQKPWWLGSRQEILQSKVLGLETEPADEEKAELRRRKLAHGRWNEENNRRKISHYAKIRSKPIHWLVGNTRWPLLAGTLDAIVVPPLRLEAIIPDIFTEAEHVQGVRDRLVFMEGTGVFELKQAENKSTYRNAWFGYRKRNGVWMDGYGPEYNHPQIQAQMHLTGFHWGILGGQIGAIHSQLHLFERDEAFAEVMDEINEEFRLERAAFEEEYGYHTRTA